VPGDIIDHVIDVIDGGSSQFFLYVVLLQQKIKLSIYIDPTRNLSFSQSLNHSLSLSLAFGGGVQCFSKKKSFCARRYHRS
jgi:hypothetical protein